MHSDVNSSDESDRSSRLFVPLLNALLFRRAMTKKDVIGASGLSRTVIYKAFRGEAVNEKTVLGLATAFRVDVFALRNGLIFSLLTKNAIIEAHRLVISQFTLEGEFHDVSPEVDFKQVIMGWKNPEFEMLQLSEIDVDELLQLLNGRFIVKNSDGTYEVISIEVENLQLFLASTSHLSKVVMANSNPQISPEAKNRFVIHYHAMDAVKKDSWGFLLIQREIISSFSSDVPQVYDWLIGSWDWLLVFLRRLPDARIAMLVSSLKEPILKIYKLVAYFEELNNSAIERELHSYFNVLESALVEFQ